MSQTEPPATAPLLPLDRRQLLRGGLLGAGLVAAPLSAQLADRGFTSGVASGEPAADSVLLWTRFVAGADAKLRWEIADNLDFSRPAAGGDIRSSPESDFCVKPVATGLEPARWYYFRFIAPDGTISDIGRTRTLPQGRTERFRMAVFSCSNIGFGWFNAYAHAAAADEFDCVAHLGDYIYEYGPGTYPSAKELMNGRGVEPTHEIATLADYRARYAQYHRDPDLQRLRQLYPMIAIADDHESANDSWQGGAENHQPATEGPWDARKAASERARREWLPISDVPWASYDIGDLATLFRLETRLTGRAQQFNLSRIIAGKTTPGEAEATLAAFRGGDWRNPSRTMIGADQQAWLDAGLRASRKAGRTWQVLVQQVLMATLRSDPDLVDAAIKAGGLPDYLLARYRSGAAASRAGLPMNMDAWDGYPAARERLFEGALAAGANIVSLAGDTHNAWASDLVHAGKPVGVEFGGQSVTSPGFEGSFAFATPERTAAALRQANPTLKYADTSRRGYMALELKRGAATCEYRFMGNVRKKGAGLVGTKRVTALAGRRALDAA